MKKISWLFAGCFALGLLGCDRAPKDLGAEYHQGRCVVCKRQTQVADRLANPLAGYKVGVCWRDDCQQRFGADMTPYVDKTKMLKSGDQPPMPTNTALPSPAGAK